MRTSYIQMADAKVEGGEGGGEERKEKIEETKEKASESVQATSKQNVQAQKEGDAKQAVKKVEVLLKAAGDAPIMSKKKWVVDGSKQMAYLIEFIKKYIRCEESESLFLYVGQAFAPSPDQVVQNLYDCFGADGKLVLHYCKGQAWG